MSHPNITPSVRRRLVELKGIIADKFHEGNWNELAALTGCERQIKGHGRLLRSLNFGDGDYDTHMMPFSAEFEPVFAAIKAACDRTGIKCLRVKDIWESPTIIQDVFGLIFRSAVVVCDYSGRNPNVFYEAGIAHTLGKHVVPLSQSQHDVPFDVAHHRYLHYLKNGEGLKALENGLASRLSSLIWGL